MIKIECGEKVVGLESVARRDDTVLYLTIQTDRTSRGVLLDARCANDLLLELQRRIVYVNDQPEIKEDKS